MHITIVIPVFNEKACLAGTLKSLQALRQQGHELIVVDGGSDDGTVAVARPLADRTIGAVKCRAQQMNAGAAIATGDVLLFLHADSQLPVDAITAMETALRAGARWGRFDVSIEGRPAVLKLVAWMMNARSRLTGIATGDQGMFVGRATFLQCGGFPSIMLMEDIALSKLLKRCAGPPACLRARIVTSGRRWERHGPWRTIITMWRLRLAYALGVDPDQLARRY